MSSDPAFVDYVCDQISGAGRIAYRTMFGEYALYCDGKVIALVCDELDDRDWVTKLVRVTAREVPPPKPKKPKARK